MKYIVILLVVSLILIIGVFYQLRSDCKVSGWSVWSDCNADGFKTRKRYIEQEPKYGGMACPSLEIIHPCYNTLEMVIDNSLDLDNRKSQNIFFNDFAKKYYNINTNIDVDNKRQQEEFLNKLLTKVGVDENLLSEFWILIYLIQDNVPEKIKKDMVVSYMVINNDLLVTIKDLYKTDIKLEYNKEQQRISFNTYDGANFSFDYNLFVDTNYNNQLDLFNNFDNFLAVYKLTRESSITNTISLNPSYEKNMKNMFIEQRDRAIQLYNKYPNLMKEMFNEMKV